MKSILSLLTVFSLATASGLAAPANDSFASAQTLTGVFTTAAGTLVGATRQVGEPATAGTESVWYKWTSPSYGVADMGALFSNSSFNRYIKIYVGSALNTLVEIDTDYDSAEVRATVVVGKDQTYYLRVVTNAGYPETASFDAFVDLDTTGYTQTTFQQTSWLNDSFSQAVTLTGVNASAIGYPGAATREPGEPTDTNNSTLWWKWTAPTTGITVFSTVGSDTFYARSLTVGTGTQVSNLIATSIGANGFQSPPEMALRTTAGTTYYIAMGAIFVENSYVVTVKHTADGSTSSGSGVGGRFSTLRRNVIDLTKISGVFTVSGITTMKVTCSTGFYIKSLVFNRTAKTWNFILDKSPNSVASKTATVVVYGYKAGKQVSKVTKSFSVW